MKPSTEHISWPGQEVEQLLHSLLTLTCSPPGKKPDQVSNRQMGQHLGVSEALLLCSLHIFLFSCSVNV